MSKRIVNLKGKAIPQRENNKLIGHEAYKPYNIPFNNGYFPFTQNPVSTVHNLSF